MEGSFPFQNLPLELQSQVISKLPTTERQITQVAKGYKELTDRVLISKIKDDDLDDPTIGIPNRGEYFKIDPVNRGEYFKPSPGLWPAIQNIRDIMIDENPKNEYALLYGTALADITASGSFKFVTLVSFNPEGIVSIYGGVSYTTINFRPVSIIELPVATSIISLPLPSKMARIAGTLSDKMPSTTTNKLLNKLLNSVTSIRIGFSHINVLLASANYLITTVDYITFKTPDANIIHIPKHYIRNGTLIMPSLREDVYILQ